MPHRDISSAILQAITQALNATQGHKRICIYKTNYYSGSKCHTGTQAYVSIKQTITQALNATKGQKRKYL